MLMHDCGQRPQLICEEPMATNTNGDLHWSVGPTKVSRCRRGKEGGGRWGGGTGRSLLGMLEGGVGRPVECLNYWLIAKPFPFIILVPLPWTHAPPLLSDILEANR